MVNTRQSTLEFSSPAFDEVVQRAVIALLPGLTAQITNEFRQNGCADEFKARLASYKFEGDALNWWKAFKQAKGGEAYVATLSWKDFRGVNNKRNRDEDRIQSANKNNNQRGYGQRGNDGRNCDRQGVIILSNVYGNSILDAQRSGETGPDDYFFCFEYEIGSGWLSPSVIEVFCKCQMPFNPDLFSLKCEACKERYHPDCINMTLDEAKQLADSFTCFDCLTPDNHDSASASSATVDP
nr:chromatin remodeling protein EBS-like [Tanacetum cinerariifolium]